jgi:hypothetical protein
MTLLKRLMAATLASGCILAGEAPAAVAQQPAKQHALSTASAQTQFRDQIARMTSLNPNEIEVHATNTMIRVVLVNTAYNGDRPSDREYLASTISALANKNAETDPAFKPVVVLHIEFLKRGHWFTKTVDAVEFRRGADGAFARHQT